MAEKEIRLSDNAKIVLGFLQQQESPLAGIQIAEAVGIPSRSIQGLLNGLFRNGLVDKGDKVTMEVVGKDGLRQERAYVTYFVTPTGADFEV